MSNRFTLWIVSPPEMIWQHVFNEVALALQSAFREFRFEVAIVSDPQQIEGTAIVLGAHLALESGIALPEDCIIYNLEQVHPDNVRFSPQHGYVDLLKRYPVWDFSNLNIIALKKLGVQNVVYCGIGYAPELTRIKRKKEDIDTLFVGGGHPRRDEVFAKLAAADVKFHQVYKLFGKERDEWIARGKIHLNIHKEPAQLFEIVRISYLLANRCFVISETGADKELENRFKDGLVLCEYDQLVERCLHYLVRPKERKQIAEAGFELFRTITQRDFLSKALDEYYRLYPRKLDKHASKPLLLTETPQSKIFVAIASYRDPECQATVANLFRKAKYPERLVVGICLQVEPDGEKECRIDLPHRQEQIRITEVNWRESKGANWARVRALELMQGEPYVLLVDSHMRFESGWDEALIDMLKRCPTEKAVLSAYCPNYDPPNKRAIEPDFLLRIRVRGIINKGIVRLLHLTGLHVPVNKPDRRLGLYPTPFCIANCMFTRAETLTEVPLDPYIHFWGDEVDYSARLWTHGYDIFQLDSVQMYHYWMRTDQFHLHNYREHETPKNLRSIQRLNHLLGFESATDPEALIELDHFGLGKERTLDGLWKFAGLDWGNSLVTGSAEEGIWNMQERERAMKTVAVDVNQLRIFVQIASYRDSDCRPTIEDLFAKAAHPERVFVGLCWQAIKGKDDHCLAQPFTFADQVRVTEVDALESKGSGWARHLAQLLWKDEEFTLMIDSGSRFESGWDDILLSMWKQCSDVQAILSCYPSAFTPPNDYKRTWVFGMSAHAFNDAGILQVIGAPSYEVGLGYPDRPLHGSFVSQQMLFAPSRIISDVPLDPHIIAEGDDITLAVRLWTYGYNMFYPHKLAVFYDANLSRRPNFASDHPNAEKTNERSLMRVRHLLETEKTEGADALVELDAYGLGKVRALSEYEHHSGVNFSKKSINVDGMAAGAVPLVRPNPNPISNPSISIVNTAPKNQPRIFVNMASYRDPECQWTVKDLFEKAKYPDRIFVGICWQFDPVEDRHCFEVTTRPDQVRIFPIDWREAEGVCWARQQTQLLWEDEEYTFMTDSHMRFVPGWDELMIRELALCESDKPLLSSSPAQYEPPNKLGTMMRPTFRRVRPFTRSGNIRCQAEAFDRSPPKPLRGAFVVCNNIFSRSEITTEVPYDPYLYFDQEEITYSARLYTHGWDVFSATRQFLYHYYNDEKAPGGSHRPLHWTDLRKEHEARINFFHARGLRRFNHLTRHHLSDDPEIIRDIELYGFGWSRTLEQYEAFCGIDFKAKIASEKALRGLFIEDITKYRYQPVYVPEIDDVKLVANGGAVAASVVSQNMAMPQVKPANMIELVKSETPEPPLNRQHLPSMLEAGDFSPMFHAVDTNEANRCIEVYAGKHIVLVFLPVGNAESLKTFFTEFEKQTLQLRLRNFWQIFVMNDTVSNLNALKAKIGVQFILWSDPDNKIARSFGVCRKGEDPVPMGFVLDPNLKIMHRHTNKTPANLALALLEDCRLEEEKFYERNQEPRVISEAPPMVIVPNVLSPELCKKCIDTFRTGHTFQGTVGPGAKLGYRPDSKVRIDHIVSGELLEEIDYKLSKSFFPELSKIFGFKVTNRELYKIGLYTGDQKGFFKQHRDNFDAPLGYRRIASTIQLSNDFEGGGLVFPEYGSSIYRPAVGSGIAFSCSTLHEAKPVTKGERFVLVAFLHSDEDEAYRRYHVVTNKEPLQIQNYEPTLRKYPELRQARDFFEDWRDKKVHIEIEGAEHNSSDRTRAEYSGSVAVNTLGNHQCLMVYASKSLVVFDDFLPEEIYQKLYALSLSSGYETVMNGGKQLEGWQAQGGFPLKGTQSRDYSADPAHAAGTRSDFDILAQAIMAVQPQVDQVIGEGKTDWSSFSAASWAYPQGISLSMLDNMAGDFTGAYIYSLNSSWSVHSGGLLLAGDDGQGLPKSIVPKKNRMVFIANSARAVVTRINEQSDDNIRRVLAGSFRRII